MSTRPATVIGFATLVIMCCAALPVTAQTGAALMLEPFAEGRTVELGAEVMLINNGEVKNVGGGDMDIYDAWGRWRVSGEEQRNVTVGFSVTYLDLEVPPGAAAAVGATIDRLVDQNVAVGFAVGEVMGWQLDAVAGIGHTGDTAYSDGQALYGMGDLIFTKQLDETSNLQLFVNYDGNRTVFPDIPLPGIAYNRRVSDELSYTLGLPFNSVTWTPIESLVVKVDYGVPSSFNARADLTVYENVTVFGLIANRSDAFVLDGDVSDRRIIFEQYRAEGGIRWEPCPNFGIEVAGGYAFEQRFRRGFDVRSDDTIAALTDEPYIKIAADMSF